MAIAQGSWNFTLPDTSSVFQYSPYSDGFGLTNGWQQGYTNSEFLTSPGEAGVGSPFHITSHPNASISLSFFGTGVTLLGEANCSYKVVLDGSERVFDDQPTISLFSEFGLANVTHNLTLTAQPSANNQTLSFSAAQLMSSAADSLTPVRIDNQNTSLIVYNGNWTTRSDSQVPNSQNPSPFFETDDFGASASFNFTGRAVEVRGVKNYGWWTYSVTLDGNAFSNLNASSWWIVPDALLFYQDGLDENATHYLRITNSANQKFALSSITVHQSSDATSSSTTPSTSPSTIPERGHRPAAGLISGVTIGVVVGAVLAILAVFWCCRRRKRISLENSEKDARPNKLLIPSLSYSPSVGEATTRVSSSCPYSSGPHSPTLMSSPSQRQNRARLHLMFGDSLFADSTARSQDTAPTSSPTAPSEYVPIYNFGSSALVPARENRPPSFGDQKNRPLPDPPRRVAVPQSISEEISEETTDPAVLGRFVDVVTERLAHRLGTTVDTPPPHYSHF